MAKVFLDANALIDVLEGRSELSIRELDGYRVAISPLSVHIHQYVTKGKVPNKELQKIMSHFSVIPFDSEVVSRSLEGPTADFEDNVQLHSAAQAGCDIFLTRDSRLQALRFFGTMVIQASL